MKPQKLLRVERGEGGVVAPIAPRSPNEVNLSNIGEIEDAVRRLSSRELAEFRTWFAEFDGALWDRQMEEDVAAGRLDAPAEEALRDLREDRCTER